jgi:hypothetical protein
MQRAIFTVIGVLLLGAAGVRAQEPPPSTPPPAPVVAPPATQTPPVTQTAPAPESTPAPKAAPALAVKLTDHELMRRREAIFVMEGIFEKNVQLAANATQREIELFQPGMKVSMFALVRPRAYGNHLDDYGVVFHVQIPTYLPSVVQVIEDIARNRLQRPAQQQPPTDPAQPATMMAARPREAVLDPDAFYVEAVRRYLMDAMLENSKALNLRPNEWLTVSARGDDGTPSELSQPSILILRVKGSDLLDYLAGRLSSDGVRDRVIVQGFSGR